MDEIVRQAVGRVIQAMSDNLGEQLTVDDMARTAMFSKFHFSRLFQRATGVSPGRFLSALRLQEAKRLLVATSLSVTEISHHVGYASVGTFSSRFRSSVGISPSTYRRLGGVTPRLCVDGRRRNIGVRRNATVCGNIAAPVTGDVGMIFVGLFPDRLPQGRPVRCTVLNRPGSFELDEVPPGTWHVLSYSVSADRSPTIPGAADHGCGLFIGSRGPVTIRRENVVPLADIRLRPMNRLDPPILLALLDGRALRRTISAQAALTHAASTHPGAD